MKPTTRSTSSIQIKLAFSLLAASSASVAFAAPSLHIDITAPASSNEFTHSVQLSWDALPAITYHVQSTTNIGDAASWKTEDLVQASDTTARWTAPEAIRDSRYYRVLTHPEIVGLEPTFIDSSDPQATLYILGELLPTNASVVINGHVLIPTMVQSNGVWASVQLSGLPPGEPVTNSVMVIDNDTGNVTATLPVQSPIIYGPELSAEQLQGPPEQPPAAPNYVKATKSRSNVQNNRTVTDGADLDRDLWPDSPGAFRKATKSRSNVQNNFMAGSGGATDIEDDSFNAFFRSVGGISTSTEITDYQEGGVGGGSRRAPAAEPRMAVFLATAELRGQETDLVIPGRGFDFIWTRTYRSRTGPTTSLGHGWDFSYNMRLALQSDGTVQFCSGNGRCDTFYPNGTNGWSRDEFFLAIGDLNKDGFPDVVTFADGARVLFDPLANGPAQDKPVSMQDRNGNQLTFGYDGLGRLTTIVDTLGRTNLVAYNASGLMESVTDFSGRMVRYEYDGNGDLTACISPPVTGTPAGNDFPGGKTNRYAYTSGFADERLNHNLSSCIDPKGQTCLQIVYQTNQDPASVDFDAVAYTLRGVDRKDIWRGRVPPSPANGFAATQVILRDPLGNVTECLFDSRQRCVREREYTGRANASLPTTPVSNRPKNKLRAGDPDFFETLWQWNTDSLCTLITSGGTGNGTGRIHRMHMVYARQIDSSVSPRKKGDLIVLREYACCNGADLDGDGVADIAERSWHYEYDPGFGSTPLGAAYHAINTKGAGTNGRYSAPSVGFLSSQDGIPAMRSGGRPKGWDGTIKGNLRTRLDELESRLKNIGLLGRFASGPRQSTDLSGSYGGRVQPWAPEICDPAEADEDCASFVISVTDPRGLLTTCTYDAKGNRTSWKHHDIQGLDAPTLEFSYNPFGQLTAITNAADANSYRRVDTFDYYTNGPQAGYCREWTVDAQGPTLVAWNFEYDSRGNVTRLADPRGNDRLFQYNALNQRVRIESPTNITERCITDLLYDANDNLTQATVELRNETDTKLHGHVVLIGHDFADRIISIAEQTSTNHFVTNRYDYDAADNVTTLYSPLAVTGSEPNNIVTFEYDERKFVWHQVEGPLAAATALTNEFDYDENEMLTLSRVVTILGNSDTHYSYDGFNRCANATDAMGNVATCAYDRNGNPVFWQVSCETNDVPGNAGNLRYHEWRWTYDAQDRCIASRESFFDPLTQVPIGDGLAVISYAYAPNGQRKTVTDDNGHVTRFDYDTLGRLVSVTDAKSNIVACAYDPNGNVIGLTETDRPDVAATLQEFSASYTYDNLNRLVASEDNVGNIRQYVYDSLDRVVRFVDPNTNVSFYVYDDLGRRTLAIADMNRDGFPDLAVDVYRAWAYDDNSRCVLETDDNTNVTSFAYDSRNRPTSATFADGTSCSLVWSPRSNLTLRQDANGTVISNSFDLLGRCISRQITPGQGVATTTTFEQFAYDGLSRLVMASNDVSRIVFAYDSMGNRVRAAGSPAALVRTFDGTGNCLTMTYPSGRGVTYTYDALDRPATVSTPLVDGAPPVLLASFSYEGPDRLARIARPNGINTRIDWSGAISPPNASGDFGWRQVSRVNHQASGGGPVIDRRSMAYDRAQNKTLRAQTVPFGGNSDMTTNVFEYDPLDRMSASVHAHGTGGTFRTYTLDGNGNRLSVSSNSVPEIYSMDATTPSPADFQMNQYTMSPFASHTYDDNGNLISSSSATQQLQYQYDYANRLVLVADLSTGLLSPLASYSYDALGRRISKTVYPPIPLSPLTTEYVVDADCDGDPAQPLEMRVGGTLAASFVLDGTRSHDDQIARIEPSGQVQFYHGDDLGNVLALTDINGSVIERYDYDDFGFPSFFTSDGLPLQTNTPPSGNPFLFYGMEWDSETSLYFGHSQGSTTGPPFNARDGRYLIRSGVPIRFDGNERSFAANNPWSPKSNTPRCFGAGQPHPQAREPLKSHFETGDVPTEEQFSSLIDSSLNLTDDRALLGLQPRGGNILIHGKVARSILKSYFQTGDKPTQAQFRALIDSMLNYQDDRYLLGL